MKRTKMTILTNSADVLGYVSLVLEDDPAQVAGCAEMALRVDSLREHIYECNKALDLLTGETCPHRELRDEVDDTFSCARCGVEL